MTDWIKFDKDDESTWPENHISVIINYNHGVVEAYHVNGDFFESMDNYRNVTHWMPLPEPPTT